MELTTKRSRTTRQCRDIFFAMKDVEYYVQSLNLNNFEGMLTELLSMSFDLRLYFIDMKLISAQKLYSQNEFVKRRIRDK